MARYMRPIKQEVAHVSTLMSNKMLKNYYFLPKMFFTNTIFCDGLFLFPQSLTQIV